MRNLVLFLCFFSFVLHANDHKVPSTIKGVTIYLSGAQITRTASCQLQEGTNEIVFTGLSTKIDESSIQVSGLTSVSIHSISFDINFLKKVESHPEVQQWEDDIKNLEHKIAQLKNIITGLEEEERVITTNRMVSTDNQTLDIEKVKQISQYYRERITEIKNEIFTTNLKINELTLSVDALKNQMREVNNSPVKEQGEITIKFDAPTPTTLKVTLSYMVQGAGWVPNYDIKSKGLNAPLSLAYKAHVYQKTGQDWKNVPVILSTETPNTNISKPRVETHYLNFTSKYANRQQRSTTKKQGYAYNPNVKKVVGTVTDASGFPLPGVSVVVKGTSKGTQTDFDGNYSIDVPYGQELQFSYIGMISQEVPLYSSIINVNMDEDSQHLDEVVVVGYGSNNLSSGISGKSSGIQIRGANSLQKTLPIYIIDGVPSDGFVEGDLDENEIQNIEIVNGSDATSIYGSRGTNGVVIITTKKSSLKKDSAKTQFIIKKPYSIVSDGDITAIEINTFTLTAEYEYFAAPIINENVFLTASFSDWEKHQLLPGEANIYFEGTYVGKTVLDPYTTKKEMVLSLGIEPNITVTREQERNFKRKSFTGSNRILDRTYILEVKNNKNKAINLKLLDRVPKSQNKEIKVEDIMVNNADHDQEKGLLTWKMELNPQETKKERFSFQVKYPRGKYISL